MMNKTQCHKHDKGAIELLEEATHLLRLAPVETFLCYYAGSLPFVLGFLFFWADMSSGGTARLHLVKASLALTILYAWMSCWQAVFASRLKAHLADEPPPRWDATRIIRLLTAQATGMPWKFIVLPGAALLLLPLGWCFAFFHNLSIAGNGKDGLQTSFLNAWRQSVLWPAQNHKMLLIVSLLTLFVFLNLCTALYLLPILLRTLLGIETDFSRSNFFFLNSTFGLSAAGLTYLCVNPLVKAAYVLRFYYGESLHTGSDLMTELRRLRRCAGHFLAISVLVFMAAVTLSSRPKGEILCDRLTGRFLAPLEMTMAGNDIWSLFCDHAHSVLSPCLALSTSSPRKHTGQPAGPVSTPMPREPQSPKTSISPQQLDRAIANVLEGLEYAWRMPDPDHPKSKEPPGGFLDHAFGAIGKWLSQLWAWIKDLAEWLREWLQELTPGARPNEPSSGLSALGSVRLWLCIFLIAVACSGGLLLRHRRKRKRPAADEPVNEPTVETGPDLRDESVTAGELPAAGWLTLAGELQDRGELRLALRALYFAGLAHLDHSGLLTLTRFKSNLDYERELKRRAHTLAGVIGSFSENVRIVERVWYGMHDVHQEMLNRFLNNHKRIMADVHKP